MTPQLPLKQKHLTGFSSVSRLFPDWHASGAPSPALLRVWLGALGYWEGRESQGVFVHVCV